MFVLADQPQTISHVWGDAFKLFKKVFKPCIGLGMTFSLLAFSMNYFFMHITPWAPLGLVIFFAFIATAIAIIFFAILLHWIHALIRDKEATLSASFSIVRSKLLTLLAASFLFYLIVSLGALLIIPGIIFIIFLLFYITSILFDDAGIFSSLRYSWKLVYGHWWQTLSLLILVGMLILFSMLLNVLFIPLGGLVVFLFYVFLKGTLSVFCVSLMIVQFNNLKMSLLVREATASAEKEGV